MADVSVKRSIPQNLRVFHKVWHPETFEQKNDLSLSHNSYLIWWYHSGLIFKGIQLPFSFDVLSPIFT